MGPLRSVRRPRRPEARRGGGRRRARRDSRFSERYHGKVASLGAAELAEATAEVERIESAIDRALTYAHLRFTTNMADPTRGALLSKLKEQGAAIETEPAVLRSRVGGRR